MGRPQAVFSNGTPAKWSAEQDMLVQSDTVGQGQRAATLPAAPECSLLGNSKLRGQGDGVCDKSGKREKGAYGLPPKPKGSQMVKLVALTQTSRGQVTRTKENGHVCDSETLENRAHL